MSRFSHTREVLSDLGERFWLDILDIETKTSQRNDPEGWKILLAEKERRQAQRAARVSEIDMRIRRNALMNEARILKAEGIQVHVILGDR